MALISLWGGYRFPLIREAPPYFEKRKNPEIPAFGTCSGFGGMKYSRNIASILCCEKGIIGIKVFSAKGEHASVPPPLSQKSYL